MSSLQHDNRELTSAPGLCASRKREEQGEERKEGKQTADEGSSGRGQKDTEGGRKKRC